MTHKKNFLQKLILRRTVKKKFSGYSLLEMIVTLALTSLIMVSLILLLTTILQVTAMTYNRAKLREDLINFSQQLEKDLRNASKVANCSGTYKVENAGGAGQAEVDDFSCVFYSDAIYQWKTCPRPEPAICTINAAECDLKKATKSLCKVRLSQAPDENGVIPLGAEETVVSQFDNLYNLEQFGINTVRDEALTTSSGTSAFSTRRVLSFYAVASHPNKRLKIENIIRQSLISTKNFESVLKKQDTTTP